MAAPADSLVQLPSTSGNTGPMIRTSTRVVGANTVHSHHFVQDEPYNITGMYTTHSGNMTILAAAQNGTSTGFLWVINLAASTIKAMIQRIKGVTNAVTTLAAITSPRVVGQLFTYTGTPSGATLTPGKHDSTWPAAQHSVRTAMTGMTITLGAIIYSVKAPAMVTGVGTGKGVFNEFYANHANDAILLRTGEGMAFYQADAGTTSDTRQFSAEISVEEVEKP